MPKDKASQRHKFSHWDDDDLDAPRSSGKEVRKSKNGIHTNRKGRSRSKHDRSDKTLMEIDQTQWLKPVQTPPPHEIANDHDEYPFDGDGSLSLAEIKELAERIGYLIATSDRLMRNVRGCGIDFGPDMDRQFSTLNKRHSEVDDQIQEQVRLYNQESSKLQQSLGKDSAMVVAELIRFESKKQSAYHLLHLQCNKLLADVQAFHEGVEGLAWNLGSG